ncbi:MAG: methyltransferase domain-containing protein, partial [bacterium]
FRQGSFHNAIACEVVEHLDQPAAFFEHLYQVIKKGGHVLVTTPNFSHRRPNYVGLGILRSFGVTAGTSDENYLHTAYHPYELATMAKAAGFTVIERGSIEHELRGWLKPLTVIQETFNTLSRKFFPSSKLIQLFQSSINRIEINAFAILDTLFLSQILRCIFKQGRRSYILAKK